MVRTHDTPAFAGNRVGFKVLNEVAQLAEEHGPLLDGSARRAVHRPRADAARDRRPGRLGHPPRDRRQHVRERATTRRTRRSKLPAYMEQADRDRHARQQERARLLQDARARSCSCSTRRPGDYVPASDVKLPDLSATSTRSRAPSRRPLRGGDGGVPRSAAATRPRSRAR